MIRLEVIGNIGQDANIQEVSGQKVINFSVAHNEKYLNAEGTKVEKTTWINCSLWKKDGNVSLAPYLKSGTKVFVSGHPQTRAYKDQNGVDKCELKMNVQRVELLGGNSEEKA